ncbi:MAG: hypothetical protein Q4D21_02030 [Phascolarctobacterium sp.]|nr:hypothetical protein [Phascolarctobacterium sp.]
MKKLAVLACTALLCCMSFTCLAAEKDTTTKQGLDWSISMQPELSAEEKEEARWSIIVENEIGINAYDMESIKYVADANGKADENLIQVVTRTVYAPRDKNLQKKINNIYKDKLSKKEKVQISNMTMVFNMAEKTYYVASMDVYSNKKNLLEHKENKAVFKPIPQGSVAEAVYEICYAAAHPEATEPAKK